MVLTVYFPFFSCLSGYCWARALGLRHTRFIAYSLMAEGVGLLERLCLLSETPERQCLLGSAYKRQAWIGMGDSVQDSLKAAAKVRCFPCRLALMGAFRRAIMTAHTR